MSDAKTVVRKLAPWVLGCAVLALVATRVPYESFRASLRSGPHLLLATINLLIIVLVLVVDTFATWVGLHAMKIRRRLSEVVAVRGAMYMLFLVNFAVGQGGFGYYLHRSGTKALQAVGATLFLMGTMVITLLLVGTVTWAVAGVPPDQEKLWLISLIASLAFAVYLALIGWSPDLLARRQIFVPLFDAGVRGHMLAILARVPHATVIILGHWVAMRVWGIDVPLLVGLTSMPALSIIAVLPISPGGIGTTQAAFVYFFAAYAPAATADQREALVLAFSIVHFVYGILANLIVGLACAPFARRVMARTRQAPTE